MIIIETFAAGCQHIRPVCQDEKPKPPTPVYVRIKAGLRVAISESLGDELGRLAERGLDISYETARCWVLKLGPTIARRLRRALGTRPPYKSSQTLRWMKPDSNFSSLSGSVPLRASGAVLLGTLRRSRRRGRMPAV